MIFSERYKLSEEAWKKWLTLHPGLSRRQLMTFGRVETAFKAGFHMGVIRAEEEAKAVEDERQSSDALKLAIDAIPEAVSIMSAHPTTGAARLDEDVIDSSIKDHEERAARHQPPWSKTSSKMHHSIVANLRHLKTLLPDDPELVHRTSKQEFSASPHRTYKVSREGAQTLADMLDEE